MRRRRSSINLSYSVAPQPEFSAIQASDGTIYHQRGEYLLEADMAFIPVNRSYRPVRDVSSISPDYFVYDKLINDSVTESDSLRPSEHRLRVFGKSLLVLSISEELPPRQIISSRYKDNPLVSAIGRQVLDKLSADLEDDDLLLGLHGSHAVGLNGVDSDMDLVAWSNPSARFENLSRIHNSLISKGYTPANETSRFDEYSVRIANLMGLPLHIGAFLASQRNRWISPHGIGTSLQLLDKPYMHEITRPILEKAINYQVEPRGRVNNHPVQIDHAQPFNYPRIWTGTVRKTDCHIISFNMVHQGMGSKRLRDGSPSGEQVLTAAQYSLADGTVVYCLENNSDYILPKRLVD